MLPVPRPRWWPRYRLARSHRWSTSFRRLVSGRVGQVLDPFHVISLANRCLDAVRRRVQNEQIGHRGRKDDPLYRVRRALVMGEEKLDAGATERLWSLLRLGDPGAEVAIAYRVKERLRDFYRTRDPVQARQILEELKSHCLRRAMPPEVQKLWRTKPILQPQRGIRTRVATLREWSEGSTT